MRPYTKISNHIFLSKLSPAALRVFVYLSSRNIANNGVCVKYTVIAEQLHLSVSTVRRAVSELDAKHLIHKRHRFGANGYKTNLYYVKSAPTKAYFTIDNHIISGNMPCSAFTVYCFLVSKMSEHKKQAFPSLNAIAAETGLSKSTVIASVKYLRGYSYLNRIHRNYRKKNATKAFRHNRYQFFTYAKTRHTVRKNRFFKHIVSFVFSYKRFSVFFKKNKVVQI